MSIYKRSMRIYKCSMGFRIPAVDQSHWSIEYNYDLMSHMTPLFAAQSQTPTWCNQYCLLAGSKHTRRV